MRIDITEKNMVWLVEHKMADTIVAEFHRKETVIESLIRERDEARAEVKRLEAEPEDGWVLWEDYERLRAELTTLRASSFVTAVPVEEYEKLKAEVERLKEGNECLNQMHEKEMARSAYLCEQVERLRKAGDALAENIPYIADSHLSDEVWIDMQAAWNAAKEGKQS